MFPRTRYQHLEETSDSIDENRMVPSKHSVSGISSSDSSSSDSETSTKKEAKRARSINETKKRKGKKQYRPPKWLRNHYGKKVLKQVQDMISKGELSSVQYAFSKVEQKFDEEGKLLGIKVPVLYARQYTSL